MSFLGGVGSALGGVASGVANTGADVAKGSLDSATVNWQRQQDTIKNNLAQQAIDLQKTSQQQQYTLAQQQHELYRQMLLDQGYKDSGVTMDPSSGGYTRTFINPRDGSTKAFPLPPGQVPLDSPQATLNHLNQLRNMKDDSGKTLFSPIEAAQIAFKMPMLYRQGPADQYRSFQDIGNEQFPDDPKKAGSLGQKLWDEYVGKAGYFHYGAPGSAGRDMSGFTPGEQREYKSFDVGYQNMETNITRMASAELANTLDPAQQQAVSQRYMQMLQNVESERLNKYNEIQSRHGKPSGQVNPSAVQVAPFSQRAWLAKHPSGDVQSAIRDAQAAGVPIVP